MWAQGEVRLEPRQETWPWDQRDGASRLGCWALGAPRDLTALPGMGSTPPLVLGCVSRARGPDS